MQCAHIVDKCHKLTDLEQALNVIKWFDGERLGSFSAKNTFLAYVANSFVVSFKLILR